MAQHGRLYGRSTRATTSRSQILDLQAGRNFRAGGPVESCRPGNRAEWRPTTMNTSAARGSVTRFARALLLAAAIFPSGRAHALERDGYSMEILVGGSPLSEYAARSTNYVE